MARARKKRLSSRPVQLLAVSIGSSVSNGANFNLPTNINATVVIFGAVSQFQTELGTVPTTFEFRPLSVELGLCQRYAYAYDATVSGLS